MKKFILSIALLSTFFGCQDKKKLPDEPISTPDAAMQSVRGLANADRFHAAEMANAKAKLQFSIEPFTPDDFVRTDRDGKVVFSSIVPLKNDELEAHVSFGINEVPKVLLSIITSRVGPKLYRDEQNRDK